MTFRGNPCCYFLGSFRPHLLSITARFLYYHPLDSLAPQFCRSFVGWCPLSGLREQAPDQGSQHRKGQPAPLCCRRLERREPCVKRAGTRGRLGAVWRISALLLEKHTHPSHPLLDAVGPRMLDLLSGCSLDVLSG